MSKRHSSAEEIGETAALYSLGALSSEEAAAFEEHLRAGCDPCLAEVGAFADVVRILGQAAEPRTPRPELRAAVLERIADRRSPPIELEGIRFVRPARLAWLRALPGVEVKLLASGAGSQTLLVRMTAGAKYPPHRHADVEELYLLEGDLEICGVAMRAGDYCRAEADSIHRGISTTSGCVFLTTTSDRDEILSANPSDW
jgi:anti-sigma factor ChrR (cupin superfamily)